MRLAIVNQPWNTIVPGSITGSIAVWSDRVAARLGARHQVVNVGARKGSELPGKGSAVEYRLHSTRFDEKLLRAIARSRLRKILPGPLYASRIYYALYGLQTALALRGLRCDIVHLHNLTQFVPIIHFFNPTARIVLHMHCEWLTELPKALVRKRLALVDFVAGCSGFVVQGIRDQFPEIAENAGIIYNGADPVSIRQSPANESFSLLYTGRVSPEKGLHVLIEAFRDIYARKNDARLVIAGPEAVPSADIATTWSAGPELEKIRPFFGGGYLKHLMEMSQGLPVEFRGAVLHDQLAELYQSSHVLVFPSVWNEPFGMPIVEAMASGLPVVATRSGGIPEIVIHGETGRLVARGDVGSLAECLLDLAEHKELRRAMGEKGRLRFQEHFTWERVAERIERVYEKVLSR